ncbi:MAG: hypothetical protein AAB362_03110 [Patescibacteria group bacterium]
MADLNFLRGGDGVRSAGIQRSVAQFLIIVFTVLSIAGIAGSFGAMGSLFLYFGYQKETLQGLEEQLSTLEDDLRPELVNRLISTSQLLADVRQRLNTHVYSSMIFPLFEKNIHGKGQLANMSFSFEDRSITTDLIVPNYSTFAEQVRLFENVPFIQSVEFGKPTASLDAILFHVKMIVKPQLFLSSQ